MNDRTCRYNISGLADEMGVTLDTIWELYLEYFNEMRDNIKECKILCNEGNWQRLERVIHNVKGISVSLNVNDIYTAAAALDEDLKNNKINNTPQYIQQIDDLFTAAEKDIIEFFIQNGINN